MMDLVLGYAQTGTGDRTGLDVLGILSDVL